MNKELQVANIIGAGLDMLDALESLILYASEHHPEELELDVWVQAAAAIRKAGGNTFDNVRAS